MLRAGALMNRLAPEVIVRFGGVPASKPLTQYLAMHARARQIVVDAGGGWNDPTRLVGEFLHVDPVMLCEALADALAADATPRGEASQASEWLNTWLRLAKRTRGILDAHLAALEEPFEGRVFAELAEALPDGSVLYVGNSMPVRDLDSFFPASSKAIRVMGNRGASGIDGLVSSALGVAAAGADPVVLVLGDLALYHDMNGLLAAKLHRLRATIVLINNDGGGIFSFLPQAAYPEHFEALFGTPHGLEFRYAAWLYGAAFVRAASWGAFRDAMTGAMKTDGLSIIEVRTDRDRNVILHQDAWRAVQEALTADLRIAQRTG
jgi:2-succinyl-5-enolpyruvyl-6-hydroxy-3-cyclohexene-1-carboxylate synthase